MSRHRLVLNAAATMASVLALRASATGADMLEPSLGPRPSWTRNVELQPVMELQPGMVKILKSRRFVQSIVVGNPNIVDATAINLNAIAITGKGVGLTNVILFDGEGKRISDRRIQVVEAEVYEAGGHVEAGSEVRVVSLWDGPSAQAQGGGSKQMPKDRRYLCAPACSYMQIDEPIPLNPPGNTAAPVASKGESLAPTPPGLPPGAPAPAGAAAPGAPAPGGRY
jgi:hypothetical protein